MRSEATKFDVDIGLGRPQCLKNIRQHVGRDDFAGGDANRPANRFGTTFCGQGEAIGGGNHLLSMGQEIDPGLRQRETATGSLEQANAKLTFERTDVASHGWLAAAKGARCT